MPAASRSFSSPNMLKLSIYYKEAAMAVLAQFGPSRGHPFMPVASAPGELSAAARKYGVLPMPALEWNAQGERETAHLYERVKNVVPSIEWPFFAPYVKAINGLKTMRGAVILADNYQRQEELNTPRR